MSKKNQPSAYSKSAITWLIRQAMKTKGATDVAHLFPRAYCIAKPAPGCAVFVVPWMDAEPQIREPAYGAQLVHDGVSGVRVGDWCALAYVVTGGIQQMRAFAIPSAIPANAPAATSVTRKDG